MRLPDISIETAAPHISRRPLLSVDVRSAMLQTAIFLAIGPQIYVDGLVVLDGSRLAGRIGGLALVKHILSSKERWLEARAADVMDRLDRPLESREPLSSAFKIFSETRFAFMPIAINGVVAATLSIRDLLRALVAHKIDRKASPLASDLITIRSDSSILDALTVMAEKRVRNLILMKLGAQYFINDRKILEFLLSHDARQLMQSQGFSALGKIPVQSLGMTRGIQITEDTTVGQAAELLMDVGTPCLFYRDKILTPWDLIMKG